MADCVEEALILIAENNFDVVLSDIHMPKCSGLRFLTIIKESKSSIQVILMTGQPNFDTATEAVRAGAFDYISKPFDREQLLKSIENATRMKSIDDKRRLLETENEKYRKELESLVTKRTSELKESEKRFKLLFEHSPIGIGVLSFRVIKSFSAVLWAPDYVIPNIVNGCI